MGFILYSTGSNSDGQLGVGDQRDRSTFTPATFLPRDDEQQRYDDHDHEDESPPETILQMAFGGTHTLALCSSQPFSSSTKLYAAGSNSRGQLGPSSSSSSHSPPRLSFQELPLELILSSLNYSSRSRIEDLDLEIVGIASSWETTFIQLRSKSEKETSDILLSMGANDWDELGEGSPSVARSFGPDDEDDEDWQECAHVVSLAQFLPLTDSYLAPYLRILDIKAGPRHIVAQISIHSFEEGRWTENFELVGWGAARHGQLGTTTLRTITLPTPISFPDSGEFGVRKDVNQLVDFAVGRDHSAFLFKENPPSTPASPSTTEDTPSSDLSPSPSILLLLGSNKQGQLGPDTDVKSKIGILRFPTNVTPLDCSWSGNYFISESPTTTPALHAFGSNSHGQLGVPPTSVSSSPSPLPVNLPFPTSSASLSSSVTPSKPPHAALVAGSEHVLLHLIEVESGEKVVKDEVWAWGWNEHGNLGNGSLLDSQAPELAFSLKSTERERDGGGRGRIGRIWAGNATSWILVEDEL